MKVTIYSTGEFGMGVRKCEATLLSVEVKPHAQYERGIYCDFVPKGKRRPRGLVQAYAPSLVILAGWGHLDPDQMFFPPIATDDPDVEVARARYSACDPRWQTDFDSKLVRYVAATSAKVLYDFRGHQAGCRGMVSECSCPACAAKRECDRFMEGNARSQGGE